jgi:hypothetical protein
MIVTPPDLVSALFFLLLLEGFRRVGPEGVVITRWRSRWSTGKESTVRVASYDRVAVVAPFTDAAEHVHLSKQQHGMAKR